MKLAFLYAGQGTQHVGMGKDLYEQRPVFRAMFDLLEPDLRQLCWEGPEAQLSDTRYTQPCMVAFACGITAELYEAGIRPEAVAGLSLGEYSALHASGVFTAQQAIALAAYRGATMANAVQGRPCGMAAVLGLDRQTLAGCCAQVKSGVCEMANFNCPGQIVIAGDQAAVEACCALAKQAGAKRCVPLQVSGPFHTSLMAPAGEALKTRFAKEPFGKMQIPVLFNCLGRPMGEEACIPELLVQQVQSSVYFEDTIRWLEENEFDTVLEIGPGRALSALVKKTARQIRCLQVEDVPTLDAALAAWRGENT